jgi:hypothetical protein
VIGVIVLLLALLGGLLVWKHREDDRRRRAQRTFRNKQIKQVERRRRLQKRLERKAGNPLAARALALTEARRLGTSPSSIAALEAALRRLATEAMFESNTDATISRF